MAFILVEFFSTECLVGQNLAPNPDLEFYTVCPSDLALPGSPLPCVPWIAASFASTDYFNSCSNPSNVGVPDNVKGWQPAHSGVGYCGFAVKGFVLDYREYLEAPLNQQLIGGQWYHVSFYVSLADDYCGIQQLGAYFSNAPLPSGFGFSLPYDSVPQIETNGVFLNDTANWILIQGCFKAKGGEAYITIGNFHHDSETPLDTSCVAQFPGAYYYIDDITVNEVTSVVAVDLGNDTTSCYSVTLDAGIAGVDYYWSNGSTDSTITVTTSGTYSLTVYDGCQTGVDSIHVQITNQASVEISPLHY
jgi:hypothetical protein